VKEAGAEIAKIKQLIEITSVIIDIQ